MQLSTNSLPTTSLLEKGLLKSSGNLLWQSTIMKQEKEVSVKIYENGLTEFHQQTEIYYSLEFSFDIQYSFTTQPPSIQFLSSFGREKYILYDNLMLQAWRNNLKLKLNQIGFNEQYKPLQKLGKGHFATVFAAQKFQDGKIYAVKAFSKQALYSQVHGKQSIEKQLKVIRSLDHQNIMKLCEVFESKNSLYVVFEYLSGGQLTDKFKQNYPFTRKQIKNVMLNLTKGIAYMHQHKIMHRDLKPENILFRDSQSLDCVIADFGLSEFVSSKNYLFFKCGTPGFVAPQILNSKDEKIKYTQICDVFSLGLIFHILLFNKSIFNSTVYGQVLRLNKKCQFPFHTLPYIDLPPNTLDLLKRMLMKNPQQRISASDALNHKYFLVDQEFDENNEPFREIVRQKILKVKVQNQQKTEGTFKNKITGLHNKLIQLKNKIPFFRSS